MARTIGVRAGLVRVGRVYQDRDARGELLVVSMRPRAQRTLLCPHCLVKCPRYDGGRQLVRRWRALDHGLLRTYVEYPVVRVSCGTCGVITAAVPWARHGARHTYAFEAKAAWCATQMSATAAARLLRCSWRTIGQLAARVLADLQEHSGQDGLDGLARIGIDEVSYRRGHNYVVVVVDHDTRRLVWAKPGRDRATVESFFDDLGPIRTTALTHITSDSAAWIARPVAARAGHAVHCADPFHVVRWAGEAVNAARRKVWNQVRRPNGRNKPAIGDGKTINIATWALRKNPKDWTVKQQAAMAWIEANHPRLNRVWQLKQALRAVFAVGGQPGIALLHQWLTDVDADPDMTELHEVATKITTHRAAIEASLAHGLSNGLTESVNTKIRLITRRAYGFKNVHNMIALAKLSLGHHQPALPT